MPTLPAVRPASSQLSARLRKHFAAGAVAAVAAAAPASAAVIFTSANINIPSTTAGVYLNLVTGVTSITPAGAPGWDVNPWSAGDLRVFASNGASPGDGAVIGIGGSATQLDNLPEGYLIDGASIYGRTPPNETTGSTAFVVNSSSNIVGIRFMNESTATINYGWIRMETGATLGAQPRTITGYAYDDSGAGIQAGAIPEPATFTLFGLCGLLGLRRRR